MSAAFGPQGRNNPDPRHTAFSPSLEQASFSRAAGKVAVVNHSLLEEASQVLGRSQFNYPMYRFIEPDESQRSRTLPWVMKSYFRFGMLYGEAYAAPDTEGKALGGAIWFAPDTFSMNPWRMMRSGLLEAPLHARLSAINRFIRLSNFLDKVHRTEAPEPHYYLMLLGVDEAARGRGVARSLMQPVLERADREKAPCYVQTTDQVNVGIYGKFGFSLVSPGIPYKSLRIWTMKREPQSGE